MGEPSITSAFSLRSRLLRPNPDTANGSEAQSLGEPVLNEAVPTVLLVDDNPITRKLLRVLVEADGYRTVEAEDGVEALAALEHTSIDVIVSDLLMPNLDGYSLCSAVRQRGEFGHIPFVLCTSLQLSPEDEAFALALGANKVTTHHGSNRTIVEILKEVSREAPPRPMAGGAPQRVPADEVMKQYRECMVRELEERSVRLEQAQGELRQLTEALEVRVRERTAQLGAANQELASLNLELERRVAERTSELAAKQHHLELRTEELARSNVRLEMRTNELACSNADLEQFASVASHDLQEPLRAVAGCVQIFHRKYAGKLDSGADELIGMIVNGSARMRALITGLLDYSRAGQTSLRDTIDTGVVLEETLANLASAIRESNAEIVYGDLPSLRFGRVPFAQVLQNLLGNALKYRGDVPPRIHIQATREAEGWVFRIADNGIGFEPQYAEKIFRVFQRLHTRETYVGTGIGLSVVKKIIERQGGKIWVESAPGQGSTFSFSVPDQGPESASLPA